MGSGGAPGICREGSPSRGHMSRSRKSRGHRCFIWSGRWREAPHGCPGRGSDSGRVSSQERPASTWQLLALQGPPFTSPAHASGQLSVDTPPQPQE